MEKIVILRENYGMAYVARLGGRRARSLMSNVHSSSPIPTSFTAYAVNTRRSVLCHSAIYHGYRNYYLGALNYTVR